MRESEILQNNKMKSFLHLVKEQEEYEKHHVITFGRMNPPTTGHLKLINKVKDIAKKHNASYEIIVSHSQDSKKNPLSSEQKIKHLTRYMASPNKIEEAVSIKSSTSQIASKPKITAATKEKPTILHHAVSAYKNGVTHLHVVVGSDRVKEMHDLLHKYNGVKAGHGEYHFKSIKVHSAGHRDPDAEGTEGMSGSKMREHAKNKDFKEFRKGVPAHVSDDHAKELMHDTRKGMGLHEDYNRGLFKAIFVTGGPGSGKDIIIREAIAEERAVEINTSLVKSILNNKHTLSENTSDYRREAIRCRQPLIINGSATDGDTILWIKEELEDLGYETLMVFVDTNNEASKARNENHVRIMSESVREEKWKESQRYSILFDENFDKYLQFDNSLDINAATIFELAEKENNLDTIHTMLNWFLDMQVENDIAVEWLMKNNKLSVDRMFEQMMNLSEKVQLSFAEKLKHSVIKDSGCGCPTDTKYGLKKDNICPSCQMTRKFGKQDSVKDGDVASNSSYIFKTYVEDAPKIKVNPEPKESNFEQDKDKRKGKRYAEKMGTPGKAVRPAGIGPEYSTRGSGTVYPMSGLGNVTYSEDKKHKYMNSSAEGAHRSFKKFREAIDSPGVDMGVSGTSIGATNKEPMQSYKDQDRNIGIIIKKKKRIEK